MAEINFQNGLLSLDQRNMVGLPNGLGFIQLGWSELGDDNIRAGVYQLRHSKKGTKCIKMRHYVTPNPRTENQQAQRSKFSAGMAGWRLLDTEQKKIYDELGALLHMSGMNYFLREYLKNH